MQTTDPTKNGIVPGEPFARTSRMPSPIRPSLRLDRLWGIAGAQHRDLKPQNIILGDYGPVVIDFGLAAFIDRSIDSLSHEGTIIGTPACMSPEQAHGNPQVTTAADVYSLGRSCTCPRACGRAWEEHHPQLRAVAAGAA